MNEEEQKRVNELGAQCLERLADQVRRGEANIEAFNQNLEYGYAENPQTKERHYYPEGPLVVSLNLRLASHTTKKLEAEARALGELKEWSPDAPISIGRR